MGGGILGVNATELSTICPNPTTNTRCQISSYKSLITNHGIFNLQGASGFENGIYIQGTSTFVIDSFINYGEIITHNERQEIGVFSFDMQDGQNITNLTNYGKISGGISFSNTKDKTMTINNYGTMGGVSANSATITLNNFGTFNLVPSNSNTKKAHFHNVALTIQNHTMKITSSASAFNSFDGNAKDNSHLVLDSVTSVSFVDKNSKLILDFGSGFEFGAGYLFSKLVVDTSGTNKLNVDFDRLVPKSDIYTLIQSGEYFIAKLTPQHSAISNIYKANVRTMNNFWTLSNSMIYPRKLYHSQNLGKKNQNNLVILRERSDRRISKNNIIDSSPKAQNDNIMLDSANILKSYESFAYRNESVNRRIQRQNKRNYSRTKRNNNSVILSEESQKKNNRDSSPKAQNDNVRKLPNQSNSSQNLKENQRNSQNQSNPQTQRFSQNLTQTPHNYYFILTPFLNHNSFAQSGNYNLSGFDYGFLTAFSAKVAESNHLGTHFIFSYGNLGDKQDKDLSIKSLNLNVGINYKLDLIWDMYLKARGDFYYFSNTLDSLTIKNIKPNNLGFGASVAYGKDFNFGKGGMLGIEAGIDYKALQSSTISLQNNATKTISETYQKALYNLIYADLGVNYNKYFGDFGLNAMLGIKGNITANKLATSKIHISTFNKSVDMMLDNDNFLGYANLGVSYVLNHKNFDMEFSLAYYGNYGDRVISNGGGVEWRVVW